MGAACFPGPKHSSLSRAYVYIVCEYIYCIVVSDYRKLPHIYKSKQRLFSYSLCSKFVNNVKSWEQKRVLP